MFLAIIIAKNGGKAESKAVLESEFSEFDNTDVPSSSQSKLVRCEVSSSLLIFALFLIFIFILPMDYFHLVIRNEGYVLMILHGSYLAEFACWCSNSMNTQGTNV